MLPDCAKGYRRDPEANLDSSLARQIPQAPLAGQTVQALVLRTFVSDHREEIIHRCRAKVRARSVPPPTAAELEYGVPTFLDVVQPRRDRPARSPWEPPL